MNPAELPASAYWQRRAAALLARAEAAEAILRSLASEEDLGLIDAALDQARAHLAAHALPPATPVEPEPLPWEEPRVKVVALACRVCGTLPLACHVERCGGQCSRCGSREVGGV